MELIIYEDYEDLSVKTAEKIAEIIHKKPGALLCFPSGETPLGTFNHLIGLYESGELCFSQSKIVGLDEWLNLGKRKSENCYSFLRKHLFENIDVDEDNICFFDGESNTPQQECLKTEEFLKKYGPIDLILLGIGLNGHVGLNEPGTAWNLSSHLVKLHRGTKAAGQKYFESKVKLSEGITLGPLNILQAKTAILQISGSPKAEIAKQLIHSAPSAGLPASLIKTHRNGYLLLDKDAAQLL